MAQEMMTPGDEIDRAAVFYDGISNRKHRVSVRFAQQFEIVENGATLASWPYDDIRRAEGFNDMRFRAVSALPLARLDIADDATAQALRARCTQLHTGNSRGQAWRIVAGSFAAACSVVLISVYGVPLAADRLAPLVPAKVEKRLGDAVDKQVRTILKGDTCSGSEGQRALAKMVDQLKQAGGTTAPLEAQVLSSRIPNAIALPGGKIYLFQGLLQKAKNPDEIAGVLAHEIGHAHHRDGLRRLIQSGGTSFLIGLLFGDITGSGAVIFVSRSLLDASYSREAETDADDFAVAAMTRLGRSPAPLGDILMRIGGAAGRRTILDSHPATAERLNRIKQLDRSDTGAAILTDLEWLALKTICGKPGP